ncbi:unnamed protein product, partial [marine sediment metagenome]
MKTEKLTLPITILLSAIILAGGYYAVQYNKQQSIEKQQRIELEAKAEIEALEREQEYKKYVAKRKMECYDLYKERDELRSNVDGYYYDEERDVCVVRYENLDWK